MKSYEEFFFESKLEEGLMGDIHQLVKDTKSVEEFVKKFFKEYGDKIKKDKDSISWVKSLYADTINEELSNPMAIIIKNDDADDVERRWIKKGIKYKLDSVTPIGTELHVNGSDYDKARKLAKGSLRESVNEGLFSEFKKATKDTSNPYTVVVSDRGKVIYQEHTETPRALPAIWRELKKEYEGKQMHVEDSTGRTIFHKDKAIVEGKRQKFRVAGRSSFRNTRGASNHPETIWADSEEEAMEIYRSTVKPTPEEVWIVKEDVNESFDDEYDTSHLRRKDLKSFMNYLDDEEVDYSMDGDTISFDKTILDRAGQKMVRDLFESELTEDVDIILPSWGVLAGVATVLGAADLAQAISDGEGSIIKDVAELVGKAASKKISKLKDNTKALIDKLSKDGKVKNIIKKANSQIAESLSESALTNAGMRNEVVNNHLGNKYHTYIEFEGKGYDKLSKKYPNTKDWKELFKDSSGNSFAYLSPDKNTIYAQVLRQGDFYGVFYTKNKINDEYMYESVNDYVEEIGDLEERIYDNGNMKQSNAWDDIASDILQDRDTWDECEEHELVHAIDQAEAFIKKNKIKESSSDELYNVVDKRDGRIISDQPLKKDLAKKLAAKKAGWKIELAKIEESVGGILLFEQYFAENIQDKADAINAFGRAARSKDFDTLVDMYVTNREFEDGEYLSSFDKVIKKYKLEKEFRKRLGDDADFTDPAGGSGLHSHR